MKTVGLIAVRAIAFLLAVAVFSFVFMYPVKLMMNSVFSTEALTAVFGVPYITVLKAFFLSFLTALLFKGMK